MNAWRASYENRIVRGLSAARVPPRRSGGGTALDKLLQAAREGRFESLVRVAQPAEPPVMLTPEQRDAARRAAPPRPPAIPLPAIDPPAPPGSPPEPEPELSVNEQYRNEHCFWRPRDGSHGVWPDAPTRCLTEYDPLDDDPESDEC